MIGGSARMRFELLRCGRRTSLVSGSMCGRDEGSKLPRGISFCSSSGVRISPSANSSVANWKLGSVRKARDMRVTFCGDTSLSNSPRSSAISMPSAAVMIGKWVTAFRSAEHMSTTNWKQPGGTVTRESTWLISWQIRFNIKSLFGRDSSVTTSGATVIIISRQRISETVSSKHMEQIFNCFGSKSVFSCRWAVFCI